MKKKTIFKGTATALITPFKDGSIDYGALGLLISMQIEKGIDALVIAGTTAEAATLADKERRELFEFCIGKVGGKIPLIFGTGTNDTKKAIEHTRLAEELGADGALVVTPYYNKGTDEGLFSHYMKIADSADIPIILYNVPSRTGVNLPLGILERLSACERIVGIKEACDSSDRLMHLAAMGEELTLYSGNDSQSYTVLALGGMGVISVSSNIFPTLMLNITDSFFQGKYEQSLHAQCRLLPFINTMFRETSPAPIKYAMQLAGLCSCEMRLPLTPPSEALAHRIEAEYAKLKDA